MLKISDISKADGKKLQTFYSSMSDEKILLGFEDGVYCQFEVCAESDDGCSWIEQSGTFNWTEYNTDVLVQDGVLTSEWVAEQKAQRARKMKEEQEKRERNTLALLKRKYEGQSE